MDIIIRGRQEGKTTELIKRCSEDGGYIVCNSHKEAQRIKQQAITMGLIIALPITYNEFVRGNYYARGVKRFHIDNVDMLIQFISKVEVKSITLSQ